jgi:hypothetical protein
MKEGYGICPVCNGSGQVLLTENEKRYSWNKDKTHRDCSNCGGQYMYGEPQGIVRLNKEGLPCTHKYTGSNVGRCLTQYVCEHCNDCFQIDSGD